MRYLLDTDICIYVTKRRPAVVAERLEGLVPGDVGMSMITFGELLLGAEKSQHARVVHERLDRLVKLVPVLPFPEDTPRCYARIRAELERAGTPIGGNDLWIAAHALAEQLTLVTHNLREFLRITGLDAEDWTR